MIVGISGTNGFIGQKLLLKLQDIQGLEIIQFGRTQSKYLPFNSNFVHWDIEENDFDYDLIPKLDKYFHLAWSGIPNYEDNKHLNQIESHIKFLSAVISKGCESILASGTCFEYLNPHGAISEKFPVEGQSKYAKGKIELHKSLRELTANKDFQFIWARIFYVFGEGQPRNTLFGSFNHAITTGEEEFRIQNGRNILDYLEVADVVKYMTDLLFSENANGVYNLGSGKGIEIASLLNVWKEKAKSDIRIVDLNSTPQKSFWADISKIQSAIN